MSIELEIARAMMLRQAATAGSHRFGLLRALDATDGPVLELGIGWDSTPYLHAYCAAAERYLLSVENDPQWLVRFDMLGGALPYPFGSPLYHNGGEHRFLFLPDSNWAHVPIEGTSWGVALVDHADSAQRLVELERLRHTCEIVVFHDADCWPTVTLESRYRYVCVDTPPGGSPTAILSNMIDVTGWFR